MLYQGRNKRRYLANWLSGSLILTTLCSSLVYGAASDTVYSNPADQNKEKQTLETPWHYDDIKISWGNAFRYNRGVRIKERDSLIANHALFDQGDALFDQYDTITNRIDWLTEFDFSYHKRYGLRISATAWFDTAYGNYGRSNPDALGSIISPNSYENDEFTPYVKRFYHGPSGEILDAFVFGTFDIGSSTVNMNLGRHAAIWGESLFGNTHAISYSQTASDATKAISNPGASAKETAIPHSQLSILAQINPEFSVVAQHSFEWRASRIPEGGTYFGLDPVNEGPNVNRLPAIRGQSGDIGLGFIWRPEWLDGTLGLFIRRFDDKVGWLAQSTETGQTRAVYAQDVRLIGISLSKNIAGSSVGFEVSHRSNAPLTSIGSAFDDRYEGAKGDTWHGVINVLNSLGPSSFYDSAMLLSEVSWSRLDRVTDHPELYKAKGYSPICDLNTTMQGCADKDFFGFALTFVPTWLQVYPGVDLELPLFISKNISGNAPSNGGGFEGFMIYKIGLTAKVYAKHQFDLAYTGYQQKIKAAPDSIFGSRVLGPPYKDKSWLSFTYQVAF